MSLNPNPHSPPTTNSPPTTSTSTPPKQQDPPPPSQIDTLLQHYLTLLDAYTTQRAALHTQQTALFQNLARANSLEAGRGVGRYGQDWYDGRMQAGRRVRIGLGGEGESGEGEGEERGDEKQGGGSSREAAVFTVEVYPKQPSEEEKPVKDQEEEPDALTTTENQESNGSDANSTPSQPPQDPQQPNPQQPNPKTAAHQTPQTNQTPKAEAENAPKDPLKWFGILTPLPLRQAQSHAITAVEDIIPRLSTLSAEMAAVELEVRRARKRRVKAEKVAGVEKATANAERGKAEEGVRTREGRDGGLAEGEVGEKETAVIELREKLEKVDVTA